MNSKKYRGKHRPSMVCRAAGWTVGDILSRNGRAVVAQQQGRHESKAAL